MSLITVALETGATRRVADPTGVASALMSAAARMPVQVATRSRTHRAPQVKPVPA